MNRKHNEKAHQVILSAFGTIALFVKNKSQVDRLIGAVFFENLHFFISVGRGNTIFVKIQRFLR